MADEQNSDNRTEEPTARRRQLAREEGKIARSNELSAAAMLFAGAAFLTTFGGRAIGRQVIELFHVGPSWLLIEQPSLFGVVEMIRTVVARLAMALAPQMIALAVVALSVGLLQSRGNFSWKPLQPDISRISPLAGFKRLLGGESLFNLLKSALKLGFLGSVTYLIIKGAWPHFVELGEQTPTQVVQALKSSTLRMGLTVALAFLAIGVLDYGIQFFRVEKSLKMSRHEVVQEHREQEGDPHIKARIRQIARQRSRQRMMTHVATADVVITNPTHIAVAIKYDIAVSGAPVVVAMGERKLAERIKAIAKQAGVPMIENKPLARAMLASCTVGIPIPPALYVAVAEILAYVYKTRRRLPTGLTRAEARV